jgi:hypothetical protein
MMTKLLVGLFGAAVIATGGYAAASGLDTDPARTVSLPGATNGVTGTTTDDTTTGATTTDDDDAGDVSGPCDEAEHRNDPRCAGTTVPAPAPAVTGGTTTDDDAGDVSGPCDEAEHRNDPRCIGAAGAGDDDGDDDDRSGRGGGDDSDDDHGNDDDDDDDRSGSNSGRG